MIDAQTWLDSRPRPRPDTNVFGQTRKPSEPLDRVYGRLMTCTGPCGGIVDVIEFVLVPGERVLQRYLDEETYVCGGCLRPVGLPSDDLTNEEGSGL